MLALPSRGSFNVATSRPIALTRFQVMDTTWLANSRTVQFEITQAARDAVRAWIRQAALKPEDYLFPSRLHDSPHLGTRQYARILGHWVEELGLDRADYGTHSMRRKKATLIYRRTKNLRAVQPLLGRSKLESTPCATLASRSMTRSKSPSRPRSEAATGGRGRRHGGAVAFSDSYMVLGRKGAPGQDATPRSPPIWPDS